MKVKFNRSIRVPKAFPKYSDKEEYTLKKKGTYDKVSSKYKNRFEKFNKKYPNSITILEEDAKDNKKKEEVKIEEPEVIEIEETKEEVEVKE